MIEASQPPNTELEKQSFLDQLVESARQKFWAYEFYEYQGKQIAYGEFNAATETITETNLQPN